MKSSGNDNPTSNPSKSEFLLCSSPRRVLLLDQSAFVLRDGSVGVSSVYYQLCWIKSIRHALPTLTTIQLVNSFIISRVDYYNSILVGVPEYQLDRLQSILNVAVRLIFGYSRYGPYHTTFQRPTTLAAGYWFQAMFDGLQNAAWSRPRLHLGLLCQSFDKPAAIESSFCKSQLSGCAVSVKDHQVWRTFVQNLRPHYVELSARLCKRCRLQVETKNLLIWIIIWLDWILQLCCKWALFY